MARKRWADGVLRVYSTWYADGNFDINLFDSKQAILNWFKSNNYRGTNHGAAVEFLIDYIKKNNFKNIVSFGAGCCAMECLIKEALPDVTVVATDFETRMINKVKPFLKEITCVPFDFYKDDVGDLQNHLGINFDFAFFSASAYAMDEVHFLQMFRRLNECGIYDVVDNSGGVVYHKRYFGWFLYRLVNAAHYMLHEELKYDMKYIPVNRPYGFGRTIPELRKLYRRAGFDVVDEPVIGTIKYVGVLKSKLKIQGEWI